jgi:hypothetical protein
MLSSLDQFFKHERESWLAVFNATRSIGQQIIKLLVALPSTQQYQPQQHYQQQQPQQQQQQHPDFINIFTMGTDGFTMGPDSLDGSTNDPPPFNGFTNDPSPSIQRLPQRQYSFGC